MHFMGDWFQGSFLVSLLNLAQAIDQPLQGMLADTRASFYIPFVLSTLGGGLGSLLIWPFARKLWSPVIYSLAFGATAWGFAVLRPRLAAAFVGEDDTSVSSPESDDSPDEDKDARQKNKSMFTFGVFTAVRGIAIVTSGFVTQALVQENSTDLSGYGLGTKWRSLMIYVSIAMAVASHGALGKFVPCDVKIGAKSRAS